MSTRHCGECSACCTVTAVQPLSKPAGVRCQFQRDGMFGCRAYDTRPGCCALYRCEWLNGYGGEEHRPDRCGVVLEVARDEDGRPRLVALGVAPGWTEKDPRVQAEVQLWVKRGCIVVTGSQIHATPEQVRWLANCRMQFADGEQIDVQEMVSEADLMRGYQQKEGGE